MKKILLMVCLLSPVPLLAQEADMVVFSTTTGNVIRYLNRIPIGDATGQTGVLVNPNLSAVASEPVKYWKVSGGSVVPMTVQEKSNRDAELEALRIALNRTQASDGFDGNRKLGFMNRCLVKIILDEINILRGNPTTTFSDRTLSQAKSAIQSCISNGDADE